MLNPDLERLKPYPFEQLSALLSGIQPPAGVTPIPLSIGEPQHAPPQFVLDALTEQMGLIAKYPDNQRH
jgi:N-succinyldiaminopimelate aminotransferase